MIGVLADGFEDVLALHVRGSAPGEFGASASLEIFANGGKREGRSVSVAAIGVARMGRAAAGASACGAVLCFSGGIEVRVPRNIFFTMGIAGCAIGR